MGISQSTMTTKYDWFQEVHAFLLEYVLSNAYANEYTQRLLPSYTRKEDYAHVQRYIRTSIHDYSDKLDYIILSVQLCIAYIWTREISFEFSECTYPPMNYDEHPLSHIDRLFIVLTQATSPQQFLSGVYFFVEHYEVFLHDTHLFSEYLELRCIIFHHIFAYMEQFRKRCRHLRADQFIPYIRLLQREPSFILLFLTSILTFIQIQVYLPDLEKVTMQVMTELGHCTGLEYSHDLYMEDILHMYSIMMERPIFHFTQLQHYLLFSCPKSMTIPKPISEELEQVSYLPSRIHGLWANDLPTVHLFRPPTPNPKYDFYEKRN